MAWGIDKIQLIYIVAVMPECGGGSGSDGNTALLLLNHPVHSGTSVVNFSNLVDFTSVIENTLGRGSLTGIDVSHNADVSGEFKISLCHSSTGLETEMCKCLVGLSHLVHVLLPLEGAALIVVGGKDLCAKFFCHRVAGTLTCEKDKVLHRN